MLFPTKNKLETLREMIDEVVANTPLSNMDTPGSIVRTLLEIFNERLHTCYSYFDNNIANTFLSTAEGNYLKMIGEMLGCSILPNETDDNYRYRISKQVFTTAAANQTSIRLKCLSIPGVKNVIITPYSHGNGSFTVHIISDEIDTPSAILSQAEVIVAESKAEGIRGIVAKPVVVPIDIKFNIIPRDGITSSEFTIGNQIKEAISKYIDNLPMGGLIYTSEILHIAQSNKYVAQAYIDSLYVNKKSAITASQYQLNWDERAYINSVVAVM